MGDVTAPAGGPSAMVFAGAGSAVAAAAGAGAAAAAASICLFTRMRCGPFFTRLHGRGITLYANQHETIIAGLKKRDAKLVRQGVRDDIMAGWNRMMMKADQD